jgi:hypothetical protein
MRNAKTLMVALVAVFAFSAIAVSAASAQSFKGPFTPPKTFTSHGGPATFKVGTLTVKCAHVTNTGAITGKKAGHVIVVFTDCLLSEKFPCKSAGAKAEEIVTNELTMALGTIDEAKSEYGISLVPTAGKTEPLASFTCLITVEGKEPVEESIVVTGSVIGKVTPIGVLTTEFTIEFVQSGGVQVPTKFESKAEDTLKASIDGGTATAATEETTDTLVFSPATEIEA